MVYPARSYLWNSYYHEACLEHSRRRLEEHEEKIGYQLNTGRFKDKPFVVSPWVVRLSLSYCTAVYSC
jgi:hypothetical protein